MEFVLENFLPYNFSTAFHSLSKAPPRVLGLFFLVETFDLLMAPSFS